MSRWGRFQDPDESAYYEFVCRKEGVQVATGVDESRSGTGIWTLHYCGLQILPPVGSYAVVRSSSVLDWSSPSGWFNARLGVTAPPPAGDLRLAHAADV